MTEQPMQVTPADVVQRFREAIAQAERTLQQARNALSATRQLGCAPDVVEKFQSEVSAAEERVTHLRRRRADFLARYAVEPKGEQR